MGKRKSIWVFKYGGNAMTDEALKAKIIKGIDSLKKRGERVVVVHGGGPFIKEALKEARIESEFIDGQRKTTVEAMQYVEMALKGKVNTNLVKLFNKEGARAVGLSGKDGQVVIAKKRIHIDTKSGAEVDLGQVGDVEKVQPELIELLLQNDFIPVLTCVASDNEGNDFNINGDLFAGHIAGALKADHFVVLTDVDGIMMDKDDPDTLMNIIDLNQVDNLKTRGVIQGGMIPKIDACATALKKGAAEAQILNGKKPDDLGRIMDKERIGTIIQK